jgi:hypothetical protein
VGFKKFQSRKSTKNVGFFGMSEIGTDKKHKFKQNYLGVNDTEQKQQTTTIVGGKSGCRDDKINNCFPGVIWGKL